MTLYTARVSESFIRADGITWYTSSGESCTVDDQEMVRICNGVIVPAANWYRTEAEAIRSAAERIEQIGLRLLEQAKDMRATADLEVANEA